MTQVALDHIYIIHIFFMHIIHYAHYDFSFALDQEIRNLLTIIAIPYVILVFYSRGCQVWLIKVSYKSFMGRKN